MFQKLNMVTREKHGCLQIVALLTENKANCFMAASLTGIAMSKSKRKWIYERDVRKTKINSIPN